MIQLEYGHDVADVNGSVRGPVSAYTSGEPRKLVNEDTVNLASALSRKRFSTETARRLGNLAEANDIESLLLTKLQELREQAKQQAQPARHDAETLLAETPREVKEDALAKLRDPDLIQEIRGDIRAMGVAGKGNVAFGATIIGVSRTLAKPIAGIACNASSVGKSFEISTAAEMYPPEMKLQAHLLTPKAMYYMDDDALVHKFVVAGERSRRQDDEQADATKALRELLSDGVLRRVATETIDGRLRAIPYEKRGPIAYVESTSAATIFGEDLNRCLILHADESREETRAIVTAIAKAAGSDAENPADVLVPVYHALHRLLKPYRVVVPFAEALGEKFPDERVEARRALPHLLGTIKAVALLRQYQKQPRGDGVIDADAEDYAVALEVVRPTLARLTGAIDQQVRRVWEAIQGKAGNGDEFTRLHAAEWAGIRESDAGGRLRVLAENGYLNETQEHRGNKPAKFKVNPLAPAVEPGTFNGGLPTADEVTEMLSLEGSAK